MRNRLSDVVRYNRDWANYICSRYTSRRGEDPMTFRSRNSQIVSLHPDARFTLNEIYLDRVYEVLGVDLAKCRSVLDLGANFGVFALYVASRALNSTVYRFKPGSKKFALLRRNFNGDRALAQLPTRCLVALRNWSSAATRDVLHPRSWRGW